MFATTWDFLFARVVVGVDRTSGVWSGTEPTPGQPMVCVWTSEEIAADSLHVESWQLRPIRVRDLVAMIPSGVGVIVDPERSTGMTAGASYIAHLRRLLVPFPAGSQVRLGSWSLPDGVRHVLMQAATNLELEALHGAVYTIDDSPQLGCLVHVGAPGADDSAATAALEAALESATDLAALKLTGVTVVALADVPAEVRSALGDAHVIHGRKHRRRWRR